ncbi:MAG: hypothetical protein AAFR14_12930, partial [Bacteroidota bacterium]
MKHVKLIFVLLGAIFFSAALQAQETEITLTPVADNTIYSENNNSNGAGEHRCSCDQRIDALLHHCYCCSRC